MEEFHGLSGSSFESLAEIPRHGYRGELFPDFAVQDKPGISLCISREYGARGGSIGRMLAKKLGWQVYDHEILQYMANHQAVLQELNTLISPSIKDWVDFNWSELTQKNIVNPNSDFENFAKIILSLGYLGKTVFVGAGAGLLLPRECRLHVRVVSPMEDRIAYISQYDRCTKQVATQKVISNDQKRIEFIKKNFPSLKQDTFDFDLLMNSSALGEDCCVQVINQVIRNKYPALI